MKFYYITDMTESKRYAERILIVDDSNRSIVCATPVWPTVYNVGTRFFALMEIDITRKPYRYLLPHLPKFVKNYLEIPN